ncbi:MAG: hypothetical protein FWD44_00830 [Oscillospiraceae bacterium]|nr:hypothetical protein [Oscillospiraceae bacterium]
MKLGKLLVALAMTIALVATFIPFVSASGDLVEFELGGLNRGSDNSWQDVDNSNWHGGASGAAPEDDSTWNGLNIDVFRASKTLIIEVDGELGDELEIVIFGNHDGDFNWAWGAGAYTYAKDDVYADGVVTIDLTQSEAFNNFIDGGRAGFRIVLNGDGWADAGDVFGILMYDVSELTRFDLFKFNSAFGGGFEHQPAFSDQDRAAHEGDDLIGLTAEIMALATELKIEVSNAPVGTIGVMAMGNSDTMNWDWGGGSVDYDVDEVYADGVITIPLTGDKASPFFAVLREEVRTGFCIMVSYYGSDDDEQSWDDLEYEAMWLVLGAAAPAPVDPVEPDPVDPVDPDPTDPVDPVDPPPASSPTPSTPPADDDGFPLWALIAIIAGGVVVVVIIVVVVAKKKK